jgi:hypothetical protein
MPGFNQTGPMGQGPMTGRKMGRCSNLGTNPQNQSAESKDNAIENMPENFRERGFGFGRGRGRRGFGMGRQNRFRGGF